MEKHSEQAGRTRCAILGVLAFEDSTGYEIRKLLSETTAHFWKESYGQIYPALEVLLSGKCNDPGSARELTHLNPSRL
jgi:DNA-binding PadR family transcriptional regulator